MRVLDRDGHRCLVVGTGLIGSAIAGQLMDSEWKYVGSVPINWASAEPIGDALRTVGQSSVFDGPEVSHVVWSAGAAGFGSSEEVVGSELTTFSSAIERFDPATHFHLLSSAGGLFEGQRSVRSNSQPAPLRPYGRLKLQQEHAAAERFTSLEIHRPSSVYGLPQPGFRGSLVATLVSNALSRRTTRITGRSDTLRDYVWVDDVGRFVARRVALQCLAPTLVMRSHLVSGRPMALAEVVDVVVRVLGIRALVQFVPPTNDLPITFSPTIRSPGFVPTNMVVAVAAMVGTQGLLECDVDRRRTA